MNNKQVVVHCGKLRHNKSYRCIQLQNRISRCVVRTVSGVRSILTDLAVAAVRKI